MIRISDIKEANRKAGFYFFSRDTMKFFASRIDKQVYEGHEYCFFVTSEKKCFNDYRREYKVRRFNKSSGDVLTHIPESFDNVLSARKAAKFAAINDRQGVQS